MCKSKYETKVMIDAMELAQQIGTMNAASKLGLSYNTVAQWRKVYNHPELFPSHEITKHYANTVKSATSVATDKIEIKAENNSASVELKVDVKPEKNRNIKGSYEVFHQNQRSYMPEFKEFAVALADKIGDKEATKELGLRDTAIPEWRSKLKWAKIGEENKMIFLEKTNTELKNQISKLKSENCSLRKYISDNYIATILQK